MCRGAFIDEVGYLNLRPEQTNIFFKLMEERYGRKATLITANLEYDAWPQLLGHKDLTEPCSAACDTSAKRFASTGLLCESPGQIFG